MNVLCGIVTYNPNIVRLRENINAVIGQVDTVLIFDNGSSNFQQIAELLYSFSYPIELINNKENIGIAGALKRIMDYAAYKRYEWVLTLDQDSILQPGLVECYLSYSYIEDVGGMTCIINDRNLDLKDTEYEIKEVVGCITSGFFCSVDAYGKTPGYDEFMFIDGVDYDICNSLRKMGYKIIKVPYYGLLHELGNITITSFLGKKYINYNHNEIRKFYIARNAIYEAKKFPEYYSFGREVYYRVKSILKILLFEENKIKKIFMSVKGIIAGMKIDIGDT